jgi:hypothetical protein
MERPPSPSVYSVNFPSLIKTSFRHQLQKLMQTSPLPREQVYYMHINEQKSELGRKEETSKAQDVQSGDRGTLWKF